MSIKDQPNPHVGTLLGAGFMKLTELSLKLTTMTTHVLGIENALI